MSRTLRFDYDILLEFDAPVREHVFVLRCIPPAFPGQEVQQAVLTLDPAAQYTCQQDGFGNLLQAGRIDGPHEHFRYTASGAVRLDHSLRRPAACHPVFRLPSAYTRPSAEMADWLRTLSLPAEGRARAWTLMEAVHARMSYVPGATGVTTTAAQAFSSGSGVCQDFAHIYLSLARLAGLPARYANGLPEGDGVSHAWCEVWLDGFWVGIDPTRGQWTDEGYIRFGAGRDFGDCPMERGVFLGCANQRQTVFMQVTPQI